MLEYELKPPDSVKRIPVYDPSSGLIVDTLPFKIEKVDIKSDSLRSLLMNCYNTQHESTEEGDKDDSMRHNSQTPSS